MYLRIMYMLFGLRVKFFKVKDLMLFWDYESVNKKVK